MSARFLSAMVLMSLLGLALTPHSVRAGRPTDRAIPIQTMPESTAGPLTQANNILSIVSVTSQGRTAVLSPTQTGRPPSELAAPAMDPLSTEPAIQAQIPTPPIPIPDIPNPFDAFDRLNPSSLANDLLNAMLTAIGSALLGAIRGFVDWSLGLGDSSLNIVTQTPAQGTYESPTVRSLWDFSRALANAALAVVVMWGGFGVMVKEHTRTPYHDLMELLPRVILGALGANLTLIFSAFLIDTNNAVAAGVGQVSLPGYDQATPTQEGIALIVTALVYGVIAVLLVLQMLMRLALIDLLIVLSPLAVLAWVLPQTQGWFRWWSSLFPTTVFQQVIQVLTLRLGASLMVELTPGSADGALLTLFLGIAVCWLTLKIPALLRPGAHRAGLSSVVSLVLVSRVAGGLMSGGGGSSAAAAGRTGGASAGGTPARSAAPTGQP